MLLSNPACDVGMDKPKPSNQCVGKQPAFKPDLCIAVGAHAVVPIGPALSTCFPMNGLLAPETHISPAHPQHHRLDLIAALSLLACQSLAVLNVHTAACPAWLHLLVILLSIRCPHSCLSSESCMLLIMSLECKCAMFNQLVSLRFN